MSEVSAEVQMLPDRVVRVNFISFERDKRCGDDLVVWRTAHP